MSWFKRVRSFIEEEDILADDFEAELDGIAEALNGLFSAGRVSASGAQLVTAEAKDIPGATTTFTLDTPSIVFVTSYAIKSYGSVAYVLKLGAGSHTLKLRSQVVSGFGRVMLNVDGVDQSDRIALVEAATGTESTGFSYFAVPNPEP